MSRKKITIVMGAVLACALGTGACSTARKTHLTNRNPKSVNMNKDRLIRFEFAPGELTQLCDAAMADAKAALDEIAAIPPAARTVDNTLLAFERVTAELNDTAQPLTFMGYVSTDKKSHDEGQACEEKLGPFFVELSSRKDLYDAIKDVKPRNTEEERLLSETLRDFEKQGLKLSADKLEEVKKLKQELSVLESQFSSSLNNDVSSLEFTEKELEGTSEDFRARLKRSPDGKFIVTTKAPDYMHIRENAKISSTRKAMYVAEYNKGGDKNVKALEQAIILREKIAAIMGFKTWADYRTWGRMAKDGTTALNFLKGLKDKLAERTKLDQAKLLKFKKELDPSATQLDAWDMDYLAYQLKKRDFNVDPEMVKEYLPAERVVAGVFEVYSKLLGVKFIQMPEVKTWAEGVYLYKIVDAKDGHEIAYFYADFFPREGKYQHFAAFGLVQTHRNEDGTFQKPVSAIVGNFAPPSNGKPSLLGHDEVETFFHEFGHIMHQTLTKAPYASLSGSNTAQDFVEAPSQLMENWAWSPKILEGISSHYKTGKKLPKKVIEKMIAAKDFNQGNFYTRQLMLGLLDMTYHTSTGPVDTTATYQRIYKEIVGIDPIMGAHFQGSFGHLMGGYDAGYYGYLWSEVYADDLFTRFGKRGWLIKKDHLLDPKVGLAYRHAILEQGRMKEASDLMKEFLGREPNSEAFFKRLGIK